MADVTAIQTRTGVLMGWYDDGDYRRRVEVEVELREAERGTELAISAEAGRAKQDGSYRMGRHGEPLDYTGGQAIYEVEAVTEFAAGWSAERRDRLVSVWRAWHLNGLNAGCEHQRAAGWDKRPIDPDKPTDSYGIHFEGQRSASWNMLTWVRPEEHPEGLMTKACPECGYRFGTAWLFEELPAEVIAFAREIINEEE